jgi:hypothetical protein
VLTTIATGGALTVAGCADSQSTEPGSGALSTVSVEGTDLFVEYEPGTDATQLAVIGPSGEAFAERALTPGASRETVPIGTAYPPGTYTVQLVDGDRVTAAVEQELRPEIVIQELQLARNHPEEMFDGAGNFTIATEVIVTVENVGTGPEELTKLRFNGDIPRPTPDGLEDSGIAAVDQPVTYTKPVISPGETRTIYSITFPFSLNGSRIECTPEGTDGQFVVTLSGNVAGELAESEYKVTFQGENQSDCQISVERIEQ